jgi:hypothetical protein
MTGKLLPGLPAPFENTYFRERALKGSQPAEAGTHPGLRRKAG